MAIPKLTEKQMVQRLIQRNSTAKSIRRERWEPLWDEVMQYLWPQMGSMIDQTAFMPGEKRGHRAYDGTPESALDIMVAGLQTGTIPENYPWFDWEMVPPPLNQIKAVKVWLQACRDIALEFLAASNFGMATNLTYRWLTAFGTACKFRAKLDDPGKPFGFHVLRLTDCVFFENDKGLVDTLFWEFKTSARNALKRWGDQAPGACKRAVESGEMDQEFNFLQSIFPREDYDGYRFDNKNMPWASWIINPAKVELVSESGFRTFPADVPRWEKLDDQAFAYGAQLGGSVYGRGPGIKCLQDMAVLNQQMRSNTIAGQKMVEPAWDIPDDWYERYIDFAPNAQNRSSRRDSSGPKIEPLGVPPQAPFALQVQQAQRQMIQQAFHVDVFLTLNNVPAGMTATEAMIRRQEALTILEPMISRQKVEHLERDLDWIFAVLDEAGYLPPPPDEVFMYGRGIRNVFRSPLFMAQEALKATKVLQTYQKAAAIVQARGGNQNVLDNLDDDEALRIIVEADGVPADLLLDPAKRDQVRQARLQQQQQMMQEQQALIAARVASAMGKVKTGEGGGRNLAADTMKQLSGENPEESQNAA